MSASEFSNISFTAMVILLLISFSLNRALKSGATLEDIAQWFYVLTAIVTVIALVAVVASITAKMGLW